MTDNRPVNLDLATIKMPITAIVSILTRASGVFLFAAMAVMIWLLDMSLASAEQFEQLKDLLNAPLSKLVLWAILAAVIYHALAGIKHLVADFGYGETLEGGVLGARLVLILSIILAALAGMWIW
ncbi:MAG: succinate dehydrogenase, cytochrome b556 subunit [Halieaceae bacterium]